MHSWTSLPLCIILLMIIFHVHGTVVGLNEFIYNGFTGSNLHIDGAAYITQEGILSLTTSGSEDITGHGFHPKPLPFVQPDKLGTNFVISSFSTTFVFAITPNISRQSGDGLAFVISPTPVLSGSSPGAYLGLPGSPFFAIELDTVADREFGDIDDNHIGIDVDSLVSITAVSAGYRYNDNIDNIIVPNFEALRLSSGNPMQVWVEYDATSTELNVTFALVPLFKPTLPLLSFPVNLTSLLGDPLTTAFVGFSASTGYMRGSDHRILGWSFNMGGPAQPLKYSLLPLKQLQQMQESNKRNLVRWLPATVCTLAMIAGVTACLVLRSWCKGREETHEDWEADLGPRRFSYKDLRRATNGFSSRHLLGKGGFGRVYGGVLATSGPRIAVKRISSESPASLGLAQFTAEIIILGRLRHRNLVRLIGYCRHKDELLLVYQLMPNGSLDSYLHGRTRHALIWSERLRVIKGIASGLLYLHEDWEQVIIHRDVKASNVLLDAEMNGRLGDFGLARLHDHGADAHTTRVAGTRGYLAPELMRFGKATRATDVFAFGAFMLEVACGRRPIGLNARGELLVLVDWVRQEVWASGGDITDAMDPRLEEYALEEAELVLKLGLLCSHPLPAARPGMRLVMQYLDGDLPLPEFSPDYLAITDVDQVIETTPSIATTITGLSGGR
ncbi:unnamed protein product [Urochloa humidicola]